jgi:hypothetical protein
LLQKVILSKYILPKSILLEGLIKDLKEKHWVKLSFFLVASESLTKPTRKKSPLNAQKTPVQTPPFWFKRQFGELLGN